MNYKNTNYTITKLILLLMLLMPQSAICDNVRFTKLDASGTELPVEAADWAIVKDNTTGVYWEIKSDSDSIHAKQDVYKFSKANKNFIKNLNETKFGGFSDWRLPTSEELEGIRQKSGNEPFIDQQYFPNTVSESYMSWSLCGTGEITPEKIDFGNKKTKGRKRYVRAVRGTSPEGFDQL